jgi:predicted dehydrogenase
MVFCQDFSSSLILSNPRLQLAGIVQRSPKPDNNASKDYSSIRVYTNAQDAFEDPEIDVIVITTTNPTHYPFSKAALENGKHGKYPINRTWQEEISVENTLPVIVEKPFTPTYAEAVELADLATQRGLTLAVTYSMSCLLRSRWNTDLIAYPSNQIVVGTATSYR